MARSAETWLRRGQVKFDDRNFDGAIAEFSEALRLDPKIVKAWDHRGVARSVQGDFDSAVADCSEALKLSPEDALIWCHCGAIKFEKGDFDGAIADCSEALRLDAGVANAWNDRGGAKFEKGDYNGAIADYNEGLCLEPRNPYAYINRALAKHEHGDYGGAIADCKKSLSLNPKVEQARTLMLKAGSAQWYRNNWRLELLPSAAVASYLEPYGYTALDASTWCTTPSSSSQNPELKIHVPGHSEESGHTWYRINCELSNHRGGAEHLKWSVQRRLIQMREDLHDPIKEELGQDYARHFACAPFAHKGGVLGTTGRLRDWFAALANYLNDGGGLPMLVARVLQFLNASDPMSGEAAGSGVPGRRTKLAAQLAAELNKLLEKA